MAAVYAWLARLVSWVGPVCKEENNQPAPAPAHPPPPQQPTTPQEGGSITAALFLAEFVKKTPWAHLDIAGPVWNPKKGGATGFGARTLAQWVLAQQPTQQ